MYCWVASGEPCRHSMRGRALRLPPARALVTALLIRHRPRDSPPDSAAGCAASPAASQMRCYVTPCLLGCTRGCLAVRLLPAQVLAGFPGHKQSQLAIPKTQKSLWHQEFPTCCQIPPCTWLSSHSCIASRTSQMATITLAGLDVSSTGCCHGAGASQHLFDALARAGGQSGWRGSHGRGCC